MLYGDKDWYLKGDEEMTTSRKLKVDLAIEKSQSTQTGTLDVKR